MGGGVLTLFVTTVGESGRNGHFNTFHRVIRRMLLKEVSLCIHLIFIHVL